ncbi:MAG: copper amine oxidase N-terminal domain-containing protein, partial [Clostridiales bacterium]|nr:copper amine oxidase N-terminal domain-containing protein [Clostridiales bacterium]
LDSTLLINKSVTARYGGTAADTAIAGGTVHKMLDLFRNGGATFFEYGKEGYMRLGVVGNPDVIFGDAQRTFGGIMTFAIGGAAAAPPVLEPPMAIPATPSMPQIPAEPQIPEENLARPTEATVIVNGQNVNFDAYNVNGNNFFKLRDLAYILTGSSKQFDVTWVGEANLILLSSGQAYETVGGEMSAKGQGNKYAAPTSSLILLDGEEVSFSAYNIEDNNYFKLRDIGEAFDFGVDWDNDNKIITVDTGKSYTPEGAAQTGASDLPWSAAAPPQDNSSSAPDMGGYVKNFPTVPYPFTSLGLDPQNVTILTETENTVAYMIDRRGFTSLSVEAYENRLLQILRQAGFTTDVLIDMSVEAGRVSAEHIRYNGSEITSMLGNGDIQIISVLNGGGGSGIDIFIVYRII